VIDVRPTAADRRDDVCHVARNAQRACASLDLRPIVSINQGFSYQPARARRSHLGVECHAAHVPFTSFFSRLIINVRIGDSGQRQPKHFR